MEAFRDCGWMAWLMLLVGLLGMGLAVVSILVVFLTRGPVAPIAVGVLASLLGLAAIGLGPVGVMRGHAIADEATSGGYLDASQIAHIREEGYREAGECIPVGGACGFLPLLGGLPAIILGVRRRGASARGRRGPTS